MPSFEIRERDLLARIGRFETKSGVAETPLFLPVINPAKQIVPAKDMKRLFGCEALITNAYIIKKQFGDEAARKGVHRFLGFPGVVMTDSGAYQILMYGKVEATPEEIIQYQEEIDADVATILDIPTGWKVSKDYARRTVDETLKRARSLGDVRKREEIAWVGPIQGGIYLDLVMLSAREMGRLPFQVYALGSPTPVMEQYLFDLLLDMILTAKMNLPPDRPFHLFGAGHPFMFSLAVALGCDLFDSAAYSIYAREGRYMTEYGTFRIDALEYFPCSCPVCARSSLKEFLDMPREERMEDLAKHNLYVCFSEIRRIKQAIAEGRLWEYVEMRAHGHPSLFQVLKQLRKYQDYLEQHSPLSKRSGIFFFSSLGLSRPEVTRYRKKLFARYSPPRDAKMLLLLPRSRMEFYRRKRLYKRFFKEVYSMIGKDADRIHVCTYSSPFGVTPIELEDVYPLSQCEIAHPPDAETIRYLADQVREYINKTGYERIVVLSNTNTWEEEVVEACIQASSVKGVPCKAVKIERGLDKRLLTNLVATIKGMS